MNNLAGEHFDINQPADHVLLRVPLEPSRPALLELRGQIKNDEANNVCAMYIRMITMSGEWLGESSVQVRPLKRNEPGSNAAGNATTWPFSIREYKASAESGWRSVADFVTGGGEVQVLSASASVAGRSKIEEFGNGPESESFDFAVGPDAMSHASIVVFQGQRQSLNLKLKNLKALGERRLGGLLGTEKHSREAEEMTQECKASKSSSVKVDALRSDTAASRLSASW